MTRPQHRVEDPVLKLVFQIAGWVLSVFAVTVSMLIVLGGQDRWQGEPFQTAMELPGAPETWGWILFAFSTVLTAGMSLDVIADNVDALRHNARVEELSRKLVGSGCTFCGIWCFAIGTTFAWQLFTDGEEVSNLGFAVWYFTGIWYLLRAAVNLKILQP